MARKDKKNIPSSKDATVVILPGIYEETLFLLAEAHDYFYQYGEEDQQQMDARVRSLYASEMSRITVRLSCVMAWLLARKAVFLGKLTQEEATAHYRLDCRDISLGQNIEAESLLPDSMTELLDKSFELYQRVARLDDAAASSQTASS